MILNFSRRVLTGHPNDPRSPGIPGLTEAQAEALDAVHFLARKHCKSLGMEKGDLRFINNMGLLHGREAFSDGERSVSERHLMRLWLHNRERAWKLPLELELVWARVFDDEERTTRWDLEPGKRGSSSPPCD